MLSAVSIKPGSIASGYYLKQDGGYYIEASKQTALYQWMGKGAERLNLVGAIDAKAHVRVFNGLLPGGIVVGKRNPDGSLKGRPGYDLTFSMNKDISLIMCCTQDKNLKAYFLNAHIKAVKTAMGEAEKMVSARKTVYGKTHYESTKNMVAALCTHFSSRAGDPQIHTHALIANVTQRSDGQWRALSTDMKRQHGFYEKIRDNATYLGHIYQNEMARATKEAGFDMTPTNRHGMFEIKSFPDNIRKHFSKRRQQIEKIVDSLPYADKNDKKLFDDVAQHSKASKEKINTHNFMMKSKNSMDAFLKTCHKNKRFDDIVKDCLNQRALKKELVTPSAKEAICDAVNALSYFSVKLDANKIIEKAMHFDLGGSSMGALQKALEEQLLQGRLLKTDSGHVTSHALLNQEKQFITRVENTMKPASRVLTSKQTTPMLKTLEASRICILKEPKTLDAKIAVIDDLIHQLESCGKKVTLLTQTKSMASQHNAHLRSRKMTLLQQLKRLGKSDRAHSLQGFLHHYEERTSSSLNNAFVKKGKAVFIIEDSQRINLDSAETLIRLTEKRDANIIFLSYHEGRRSPLAHNVLALLEKSGVPSVTPPSKSPPLSTKEIPCQIHEIKSALNATVQEKQRHRQQRVAQDVVQQHGNKLSDVQVFALSCHGAEKQSALIREALRKQHIIGQRDSEITTEKPVYLNVEEKKHAKFFKKGWVVKTYVGRGQFEEKTITHMDEKNNRLRVRGLLGREKYRTPTQLLRDPEARLYERKTLPVATGDRIRVASENKISKQRGLSINTSYQVELQNKKIMLTPDNTRLKKIKTNVDRLNGCDLSHDYVKTWNQPMKIKRESKRAILEAPAYALDKNRMNELKRHYERLDIYTDNQTKAERKLGIEVIQPSAIDLNLVPVISDKTPVQRAVSYGLSVVASREAAFTVQSVIEKALSYDMASLRFSDIRAELINEVRSGHLQARKDITGDVLLATQETIDLEKSIISQIKNGKNVLTPFMKQAVVHQRLENTTLTQGQKKACVLLASTADRFVMVQGYSGTGKSTMLQTLKRALEENTDINKDTIIALAPTHKAVKELKEKGIEAQTLKSFLVDETADGKEKFQHLENKLILLDESSMVSNTDFKQLQTIVEQSTSCHCAYIGDIAQLLSVEDGKPSELAYISKEADIATAIMDEILRQKNPELKAIAKHFLTRSAEQFEAAFHRLEKLGAVIENKNPIHRLAKDYGSLPPDERRNTLVAIATNKNRRLANEAIRDALSEKKELTGPEITTTILTDSRLTNAELHHSMNYKKDDMVRLNHQYFHVSHIHHKKNTLELRNDHSEKSHVLNLSLMPENATLECFHTDVIRIQAGDELKWTKTDKERGLTAHESLIVTRVDREKKQITAKNERAQVITIDLRQHQNQHMDYNYTSTVHGLQGATATSVMMLLDSKNRLSNNRRLMYVAITRATDNAMLYTDSFSDIRRQIIHTKGDKTSALEAMGLLEVKNIIPNASPTRAHTVEKFKEKKARIDAKQVEAGLRHQVKRICEDIFGKPNQTLSHANHWRYGNRGSLSIVVDGPYQGSFHNFESGEKGGMIQLLMSEMGMDFKSALEQGHHMVGGNLSVNQKFKPIKASHHTSKETSAEARKTAYIHSLIKQSVPLKGTVAEKYLLRRGIQNTDSTHLRFIKKISTGVGNKEILPFACALLSIAKDKNGDPKAIQATYLDPKEASKIETLKIKKRTIGLLKDASVNLSPEVMSPKITFVAEGVETALSIKDALQTMQKAHAQVLATLGKTNLANMAHEKSANNIILILDNDRQDWRNDKAIQSAILALEAKGKQVTCIQPKLLGNQKTDYNDLAKAGKFDEIAKDIGCALTQFERQTKSELGPNENQAAVKIDKNITKIMDSDRELFG